MILTPMCVAVVLHVRLPITKLSVLVQRDTLEIRLSAADHLKRKICVHPTHVDLVPSVRLVLTGQVQTDQSAHVQLDTEEIHSLDAQEESVSMTVSVHWTELVLISTVDLRVRMLVVRMPSARPGTMVLSAPVHLDTLVILSLLADNREELRAMLLDSLDLSVILILTFYFSQKTNLTRLKCCK